MPWLSPASMIVFSVLPVCRLEVKGVITLSPTQDVTSFTASMQLTPDCAPRQTALSGRTYWSETT